MGRSSTSLRYCGTKTDTTSPEWLDPRLHISPTPGTLTARQCRDASRQTLQAHPSSREAIRRGAGTPAPIPRAMPPAGSCAIAMSRRGWPVRPSSATRTFDSEQSSRCRMWPVCGRHTGHNLMMVLGDQYDRFIPARAGNQERRFIPARAGLEQPPCYWRGDRQDRSRSLHYGAWPWAPATPNNLRCGLPRRICRSRLGIRSPRA